MPGMRQARISPSCSPRAREGPAILIEQTYESVFVYCSSAECKGKAADHRRTDSRGAVCRPHVCAASRPQTAFSTAIHLSEQVLDTDFWVVVPIESLSRPGEHLEGTRLTLVRLMDQPDAFELSIRTPVTPHRWKAFDQVLEPHDAYWDVCGTSSQCRSSSSGLLWHHRMLHKLWRSMLRSSPVHGGS